MIEIPKQRYEALNLSSEKQYFDYLKDKTVVLVGPADYLVGQGLGAEIDKYDVIARLNLGCPVPEGLRQDIGSRTDVLYHVILGTRQIKKRPDLLKWHTEEEIQSWKDDGVKWFVSKRTPDSQRVRKFAQVVGDIIPWTAIPRPDMRRLEIQLRTNPNMGTVAVWHVLRSEVKSLYVTGCDFHRTGYHVGYGGFNEEQAAAGAGSVTCWGQIPQPKRRSGEGTHSIDKQLKYLARLRIKDDRFKTDKVLSKMLDEVAL